MNENNLSNTFSFLFYNRKENFDTSPLLYEKVINGSDTILMCRLSAFYYHLPDDLYSYEEKSLRLLEKACSLNDIFALERMGDLYRYGTGYMGKNIYKSISFYKKGAELKNYSCMLKISDLYESEFIDENENYKESLKWIKKALKENYPPAFYKMGCFYEEGKGVEYNSDKAIFFFEKGAKLKDDDCLIKLGY